MGIAEANCAQNHLRSPSMSATQKAMKWFRGTTQAGVVLAALCCAAPQARANTYLFSFTATDVLNALHSTEGNTVFNESAYFAIFVQPSPASVSSYAYNGVFSGPNTGNPDAWQVNTITDPSNPNLGYSSSNSCISNCTWVQYSKQDGQTSVMVLSQADPANGNNGDIFLNAAYHDNVPAPYGWGLATATITSVINGTNANPTFTFGITTSLDLTGPITLLGYASELRSTSSGTFTTGPFGTKEHDGIAFTLTETPSAVPEPGSSMLVAGGFALLVAMLILPKHRRPFLKEWHESIMD
jgi:hypothetical protein